MVDYQKTIARLSKGHHLQSSHAALPKRGLPTKRQTSHHSPLSVIYDTSFTRPSHAANVIARLAKPILLLERLRSPHCLCEVSKTSLKLTILLIAVNYNDLHHIHNAVRSPSVGHRRKRES